MKNKIKTLFWIANVLLLGKILLYLFSTAPMQEEDYQKLEKSNQTFHKLLRVANFFGDDEIYLFSKHNDYEVEKMQQTKIAYKKKLDSLTHYLKQPEITQNELISFAKNYRIYLSNLDTAIRTDIWGKEMRWLTSDFLDNSPYPDIMSEIKNSHHSIKEVFTIIAFSDLHKLYGHAINTFPLRTSNNLFLQPYRLNVFVMPKTNVVLEGGVYEAEVFVGQRVCYYVDIDVENDDTPLYQTSFEAKGISFVAKGTDFDSQGMSKQYWQGKITVPTVRGDTILNVRHYYKVQK